MDGECPPDLKFVHQVLADGQTFLDSEVLGRFDSDREAVQLAQRKARENPGVVFSVRSGWVAKAKETT